MNDVDQRSSSSKEVALAAGISFLADYGLSTALAVGIDVLRGRKGVALALARLVLLRIPLLAQHCKSFWPLVAHASLRLQL